MASDAGTKPETAPGADTSAPPARPVFGSIVGYTEVTYAEDLVVQGDYAYVCAKSTGLVVLDVSTPSAPSKVQTIAATEAWDAALGQNHLYLADKAGGLRAFDLGTTPASPVEDGKYAPAGWHIDSVYATGGKVYVAGGTGQDGRVAAVDPSSWNALATYEGITGSNSNGSALAASGDYVYYGRADGVVVVLKLEGAAMTQVATLQEPDDPAHAHWALGMWIDGTTLYVAQWGAGVWLVDITNPAAPTLMTTFVPSVAAYYDVWAKGDRAYVGADAGLAVVDVSDPKKPLLLGNAWLSAKTELDDGLHGVWVVGDYAYVADNKEQNLTVLYVGE